MRIQVKGFKLKRSHIYVIGTLALLLFGGIGIYLINQKQQRLNKRLLGEFGVESELIISKILEGLDLRIEHLNTLLKVDKPALVDTFITQDSVNRHLIAAYIFRDKGIAQAHPLQLPTALLDSIQGKVGDLHSDSKFVRVQDSMYVVRQVPLAKDKDVVWVISISELNAYFARSNWGNRAYFSLYTPDGICLINPDIKKVGLRFKEHVDQMEGVTDSLMVSDFIGMDVLSRSYNVTSLLGKSKIILSVLLFFTEEEVSELSRLTFGLGFGLMSITIIILQLLYRERKRSQAIAMMNLQYEKEKAIMRFESLREQMNPHFLFNSLGTLQQLIPKENNIARRFVNKLARVYRQVLQADRSGLSSLPQEVELVKAYAFLQEIRFGANAFRITIDDLSAFADKRIPYLSLQTLVENAIKHNELSEEFPLLVRIQLDGDGILISNKIRKKSGEEAIASTGYGISYLANVYQYAAVLGFYAKEENDVFSVRLPFA